MICFHHSCQMHVDNSSRFVCFALNCLLKFQNRTFDCRRHIRLLSNPSFCFHRSRIMYMQRYSLCVGAHLTIACRRRFREKAHGLSVLTNLMFCIKNICSEIPLYKATINCKKVSALSARTYMDRLMSLVARVLITGL